MNLRAGNNDLTNNDVVFANPTFQNYLNPEADSDEQ